MDTDSDDDERKPLLNKKEVRQIVDQASRLRHEEEALLAQSGLSHFPSFYSLVNPLYTDTRYNDKIFNNVNFTGTKPSLRRWQLEILQEHCIQ